MATQDETAAAAERLKRLQEEVAAGAKTLVAFLKSSQNDVYRAGKKNNDLPGNPIIWSLLISEDNPPRYFITETGQLVKQEEDVPNWIALLLFGAGWKPCEFIEVDQLTDDECEKIIEGYRNVRRRP